MVMIEVEPGLAYVRLLRQRCQRHDIKVTHFEATCLNGSSQGSGPLAGPTNQDGTTVHSSTVNLCQDFPGPLLQQVFGDADTQSFRLMNRTTPFGTQHLGTFMVAYQTTQP